MTTDGSISDIPRAGYEQAEGRVIAELEALGKPYVILLNSTHPDDLEKLGWQPEEQQIWPGRAAGLAAWTWTAPP